LAAVADPPELTIDELARQAGLTVRNVRAYRSRGLLPGPRLRGRKGFYGPEHLARLELIADLRARGFNLEAIGQIVERASNESLAEALDFARAVLSPEGGEEPRVVSSQVFLDRWGEQLTPEVIRRSERLGLVRRVGDDQWEIPSPRLERAGIALSELGVPLEDALEITAVLKRQSRAIARAYVELFTEQVWRPFEEAGEPKEDWQRVREALDRLRPLAGEALLAVFQVEMRAAVEQALEAQLSGIREAPKRRKRPAARTHAAGRRRARR
jgi:DNA-binding transcriptional MerR regulator